MDTAFRQGEIDSPDLADLGVRLELVLLLALLDDKPSVKRFYRPKTNRSTNHSSIPYLRSETLPRAANSLLTSHPRSV